MILNPQKAQAASPHAAGKGFFKNPSFFIKKYKVKKKATMKKKLIFLFLLLYVVVSFSQSQRPNIVFIMTDDQSAISLRTSDNQNQSRPFGFNGDDKVHTPIIDDLASKGIVFSQAYVSTSICTPSRYAMLTGKYAGRSEG